MSKVLQKLGRVLASKAHSTEAWAFGSARYATNYAGGIGTGGINAGLRNLIQTEDDRVGFPVCAMPENQQFASICPEIIRQDVIRFFHGLTLEEKDVRVQYNPAFRPAAWWIRFSTQEDRDKALKIVGARWGGRKVIFEPKTMVDWREGTYNHLVGQSFGSAVLVSRMAYITTDSDVASFFRNFHLQGNGVTLIQDALRPEISQQNNFKRAIVRLITPEEAQRASRSLHRRFMRNSKVIVKVLQ